MDNYEERIKHYIDIHIHTYDDVYSHSSGEIAKYF